MIEMLTAAKEAKKEISVLTEAQKNNALLKMADALVSNTDKILAANRIDIEKARGSVSSVMIDRLMLNADRIAAMAEGIRVVAKLPDPVGLTLDDFTRDDGLRITKVSVPVGVKAII